ncbi:iron complex transport system permease protein [Pedobacter cryoconitis]|uniref:Iron complex transport system permease protein n=1 Tax=Pedobacter cryoconitis TaxID=188932 RepID=A0A7W8YRN9_9SPHI|nr:iron ABC transporter permease [Pedobacter cryoconitis]MBB5620564.1 iron complex transport system permease protein [Pedobacter cryoconitis]MBB5646364.1 iron complex transport system permease protein [Pedobacter cryoconitis]
MNKIKVLVLLSILVVAFLLDVALGSVHIPLKDVIKVLFTPDAGNDTWVYIIEKIRLPKALTAIIVGCGLSVSGLQMQTLFRNPLAGPSVLGITAGASLGVALVMLSAGSITSLYTIKELGISGSWLIIVASSLGAALIMILIVSISSSLKDNVIVLIVGVMIGNITLSVISIWQYFSSPELIKDYLLWTFGSLGGVTGGQLLILAIVVFAGLLISFLSSKLLDALLLGDNYARSMGLTVKRARILIIGSTSILAGGITAFCGPIGFIGIAVPHLARALFNTSNHRILIPACCLIGTVLMLICDIVAQLPGSQTVLPINVITALVGSPVVIWIIAGPTKLRGF